MSPKAAARAAVGAPAKLNLYLHVVGRRADGYHLIDSLIAFAEIGDEVAAAPAAGLTLTVTGPFAAALGTGADNLVLRAARGLAAAAGIADPGASLTLTKHLPVAAGLGGGSADAAATLRALCELWRLEVPPDALSALALALGADVPVCLYGAAAVVGGIGERIRPGPHLPPVPVVLANPGVALSTAAVFRARSGPFGGAAPLGDGPFGLEALAAALGARRNELTAAALSLAPPIGAALAALERSERCLLARMSGSGPTCFGIYPDEAAAAAAARAIADEHPGWWVSATRLVGPARS